MAFVSSVPLQVQLANNTNQTFICHARKQRDSLVCMAAKPRKSSSRRFVPGKGAPASAKRKLEPEEVFVEVSPSWTELIVPTLSILTVIGIIPFIGSVARQAWVRYKLTNRRISVTSGFQGKDSTEIIYRDIAEVKFVRRMGGTGDMVIMLKDGAKLELRTVPELDKIYEFVMSKVDEDVRNASGAA